MDFFVPYDQLGVATPGPWQNASPAAGTRGSILNALVFPAIQGEILNVQDAAGLTRNAADFTQLLQALKILIPKYAPAAAGATSKGGLALDASNNFLLSLLANLNPDTRTAPVASDVLPLGRAADGAMVSVTAQSLAAYIAGQTPKAPTYGVGPNLGLEIDGNNNFGLALGTLPGFDNLVDGDRTALLHAGGMYNTSMSDIASYVLAKVSSQQYTSNFSTTGSGYAIFQGFTPNPLIAQWTLYAGSGHGPYNVPFPLTFPNKVLAMFATDSANQDGAGSGTYSYGLDFSNNAQAQIFSSAGSGTGWHARLFALGY